MNKNGIIHWLLGEAAETTRALYVSAIRPFRLEAAEDFLTKAQLSLIGNFPVVELRESFGHALKEFRKFQFCFPVLNRSIMFSASLAELLTEELDRGATADKVCNALVKMAGAFHVWRVVKELVKD